MPEINDPFDTLRPLESSGQKGLIYSLPALEEAGFEGISKLPVSIRIVLESVLRNCDGDKITREDVKALAAWNAKAPAPVEIPFVVSRIVLQDFTGVPLLVDLAAMRDVMEKLGRDPARIEPQVPVELVVDHSVQVDRFGTGNAFQANLELEFERNRERYEFLKWGQQAFQTFRVVPPASGIVHQVNLETLAKGVFSQQAGESTVFYPDTLVGTDSHTTMINGLGIVGWGVGGIEAEAGMLGQPVYFLTPEVIGVHLTGSLREGVTATDLTLRITQMLREHQVVGKFVEFYGIGAAQLNVPDRATIANMAPEYGATMGFFPVDEKTLEYFRMTGRSEDQIDLVQAYFKAQGLFGIPGAGELNYTESLELDLSSIVPSVAGPKRPQDRIDVPVLKETFNILMEKDIKEGGFEVAPEAREKRVAVERKEGQFEEDSQSTFYKRIFRYWNQVFSRKGEDLKEKPPTGAKTSEQTIGHGSVLIAAITSCTNTSNPSVMIAAGLLAKRAVERGLRVNPNVKTSLAPGSRVVTDYLEATGLQRYLDELGFNLVGYGCTTCIGNSGPLDPSIEKAIKEENLVVASVLSGNRNFEARVHPSIKANFLMSPPLVVAYALAGRVDINLETDPLGIDGKGQSVYLNDLWPTSSEIQENILKGIQPEIFTRQYSEIFKANPQWQRIQTSTGKLFEWQETSTYIQNPPFFENFEIEPGQIEELQNMRALGIFGDSVTTDHISPAGAIPVESPAGIFLRAKGIAPKNFNSFGSRRGNDRIMTRGTFANVRIKNLMASGRDGGWTKLMPEGKQMPIYDACQHYAERGVPLIVFSGFDYGMGSSRDWAAKGSRLLGVKAVVARSFERIHRSNLIGMGVLPLEFKDDQSAQSLGLDGSEVFSILGLSDNLKPKEDVQLQVQYADGRIDCVALTVRIDTLVEMDYYRHGGILLYVLRQILDS